MSRLTGTDAYGLMGAYNAVYAPQEITEEQVWEEVETWVNSLIEEGYDLSDYTWEEMYESYIEEQGGGRSSGASPGSLGYKPKPMGTETGRQLNQVFGQGNKLLGSAPRNTPAPGTRQNLRGGGSRPDPRAAARPSSSPKPQIASLPSSARQVTQYPQGVSTGVGGGNAGASRPAATSAAAPRPAAPAPAARPAAGAATPAARPAAPAAKAAPAATAPSTAAIGFKLAQQGVDLAAPKKPSLRSDIDDLKNMGTASRQRQGLTQSFDPFDVVLGHLIDEGYADTEESATAIMANMSEEWRQSIFEAQEARNNPEKYEAEQRKRKGKKQIAMNDPHTGINSPAFAAFMKQQGR